MTKTQRVHGNIHHTSTKHVIKCKKKKICENRKTCF